MIIDEKVIIHSPPPPYAGPSTNPPPPFISQARPRISSLPSHILLLVVYLAFPQSNAKDQPKVERQRKTLMWLASSLRLVNRSFYIACMHVLRSTYLPAYTSLIRPPYSSDPFPASEAPAPSYSYSSSSTSVSSPLQTLQRETAILDRFIALKVREDVFTDDSELHLEREDMFKDLFDLAQPRARLEDLVRIYGVKEGAVLLSPGSTSSSPNTSRNASLISLPTTYTKKSPQPQPQIQTQDQSQTPRSPTTPLSARASAFFSNFKSSSNSNSKQPSPSPPPRPPPLQISPPTFSRLSISFNPRNINLVLATSGRKRTIVELQRKRDDTLELSAKRIVYELKAWLSGD